MDVAALDIYTGKVQIAYGNGDGSLTGGPVYPGIPSGGNPYNMQIGYLNGDGNLDPTGTVTFSDGSTTLGSSSVAGGTASLQTSALSVGTHAITASYSGDANNNPSSSQALNQVITGSTTMTVTATSGSLSHTTNLTVSIQ
jgi:Bacterial Ig-like domain (group 3)